MENNLEILELLISSKKEKKNKEPNSKEKAKFRNAWVSFASENGFAGRAEQLLYDGFSFCGAEPFYAYLVKMEDQNAALSAVFSGKYYGKSSDVTFRLLTHLLALMLNGNASKKVLAPIIERLPGASIKKNKKQLGTVVKTIEIYFLAELKPDAVLCPLLDIGTGPKYINEFVELISSALDEIEKNSAKKSSAAGNIEKIRKWFADYKTSQSSSSANKSASAAKAPEAETKNVEIAKSLREHHEPAAKAPEAAKKTLGQDLSADRAEHLVNLLRQADKIALAIKADGIQQKSTIEQLNHRVENEQEKNKRANQQIAEQQDTLAGLQAQISSLEGEIIVLHQEIAAKEAVIAEKTAEIKERSELAEVLSRDRSNQANEMLHRLGSKIRVEYRDFLDALNSPMSCELGENLKVQLQSVFDILIKDGMKIE